MYIIIYAYVGQSNDLNELSAVCVNVGYWWSVSSPFGYILAFFTLISSSHCISILDPYCSTRPGIMKLGLDAGKLNMPGKDDLYQLFHNSEVRNFVILFF